MPSSQDDTQVILQQRLLNVDEVFVYKIPPMKTSDGHRAEDWDLSKPLETCSLLVERIDADLFLKLFSAKPKKGGPEGATEPALFAQCQIKVDEKFPYIKHWVEPVVDSSRYFVIRISSGNRQAYIGVGFRERDDASDFRLSLQDYEHSLKKEYQAEQMHQAYEQESQTSNPDDDTPGSCGSPPLPSKLGLKDGEKMHISLKGTKPRTEASKKTGGSSSGGMLLRKPPPSPMPSSEEGSQEVSALLQGMEIKKAAPSSSHPLNDDPECAIPSRSIESVNKNHDEDEWRDFEESK